MCLKHPEETLRLYCETTNESICRDCTLGKSVCQSVYQSHSLSILQQSSPTNSKEPQIKQHELSVKLISWLNRNSVIDKQRLENNDVIEVETSQNLHDKPNYNESL